MSKLWSNWKPVLLLGIVTVIWITLNARWSPTTWSSAGGVAEGDLLEIAARIQVSAEQLGELRNTYGIIDRLGAPFGADWSGYPVPDRMVFGLTGMIAKVGGVYAAINLMILLGLLLNCWAFYGCARALRWHSAWAYAGAILFTFSVYNLHWAGTLSLGWTFALPPAVLCLQWIASRNSAPPPRMTRRMTYLAALLGLWIGAANPYFTYYISILLGVSLLLQIIRHRVTERLRAGGVWLVAMLISFGLTHAAYIGQRLANDEHTGSMERNYAGTELYALRPIELFLPPASHRNLTLARFGETYRQQSMFQSREPNANYLGFIGAAGLSILALVAFRHAASSLRDRQLLSDAQLAVILTLLFTCVGGINGMVAYLGLDWFRASNRLSIFILIWCLFAVISWVHRRSRGSHQLLRTIGALGLVGVGLYDTLPRGLSAINHQAGLEQLVADHVAAKELSDILSANAMVFQLPATPFPEAGPRYRMGDYEHFRFFLACPGMRFSYGFLVGSKSQLWSEYVAQLPPFAMITELARSGFDAVLIDKRGFPDRAKTLIAGFTKAGQMVHSLDARDEISLIKLQPVSGSQLPDLSTAKIYPIWDLSASFLPITIHAVKGWFDLEIQGSQRWRWAGREAVLGLWNGHDTTQSVSLTGRVSSISTGRLTLTLNGDEVRRVELQRTPMDLTELSFSLPPGSSQLKWHFDGRLVRPVGDPRTLGFQVEALQIHPTN